MHIYLFYTKKHCFYNLKEKITAFSDVVWWVPCMAPPYNITKLIHFWVGTVEIRAGSG
ncbi:hypothetical protein KDAU_23840 [Dictyobacter aurantiacus]|uniref:Uncharacterized protein n=1 Tax=Dictyobacter aurantiacus TaxID=1936993 RepID=A0A401ZDX7_9CHLR|nr:hypothetical protein KDAU_23840 [Dictyobacter aurantiacus]